MRKEVKIKKIPGEWDKLSKILIILSILLIIITSLISNITNGSNLIQSLLY